MPPTRNPRARALPARSGDFDVWLPLAVAIAAALFMLSAASAQTAAPRTIFDPARFETPKVTPVARPTPVVVVALPSRPAAPVRPSRPEPAFALRSQSEAPGPWRVAAALGIAALLIGALTMLGRTWRRLENG